MTLRIWPGVAAAILIAAAVAAAFVLPPETLPSTMIGAVLGGLLAILWWLLFSRAPWLDRLCAVALIAAALAATRPLLHPSITGAGMGMLFYFLALPVLGLVLVAWAVATRTLGPAARRASMAAAILLACGAFALVRTAGTTGRAPVDLHWRWTPTPEELLLAREPVALPPASPGPAAPPAAAPADPQPRAEPSAAPKAPAASAPAAAAASPAAEPPVLWPGFRGPGRDGVVHGLRIATDWTASPPVALWRRAVGPAWSSFAVRGDLLYTQEQRGEDEIVACYRVSTGEPVWRHLDAARFWESNEGAGPRGTPALDRGRVYSFGATGIVNALDAADGKRLWTRNAAADAGRKVPYWGFSASPLVAGDLVIVAAAGTLVAYDAATGQPRWQGPARGGSYSSAHRATLDGVPQVLLLRNEGVTSVAPADGAVLWEHAWPGGGAIVQPALTADDGVLITTNDASGGIGIRRLAVTRGPSGWSAEERWTSQGLKPYFSDFVVHDGHAYGVDGTILSAIDLADGTRKWKGGRYGQGQLLLLAEQDLLLVLSEHGELALVAARPDGYREIARAEAIEGKTWNHPALAGDVLLVRNDEEMAAFRLATQAR
jgi:outer membrane protein assembly factor BamB